MPLSESPGLPNLPGLRTADFEIYNIGSARATKAREAA